MWEGNTDWLSLLCALTRDQTGTPGMCRDGELNLQPFALQNDAQPTEPQKSGLGLLFRKGWSLKLNGYMKELTIYISIEIYTFSNDFRLYFLLKNKKNVYFSLPLMSCRLEYICSFPQLLLSWHNILTLSVLTIEYI